MVERTKYLTEATLFAPAANKWAADTGIMNNNGGLLVLKANSNLAEITDPVVARINLGLRMGVDVQPYSERLTAYANGAAPSAFSLAAMAKASGDEWRAFIGAGTVTNVTISGGNTGLIFTNGSINNSGTATLTGVLSVGAGGTGVSNLLSLKSLMGLSNVDNTSDANKPISTATQLALDAKFDKPIGSVSQYIRGDGTLAALPASGTGTVTSVTVSGGATGLSFNNSTITNAGTATLTGTLSLANGGTGVTGLSALRALLSINNVDNTSDANKPISIATQAALDTKASASATSTALDRRVRIPASFSAGAVLELPTPETGKVLGWNDAGTALINVIGGTGGGGAGAAYVTVDIFDSDGTSRVFTLTKDPGSLANVSITIGGVAQTPGVDYTLSGSVITLTTVPPNLEKIVVRSFSVYAVGALTATQIGTLPFTGDVIPDSVNAQIALQALETAVMDLRTSLDTKVSGPISLGTLTLPDPESGKVIGWNNTGTGLINITPGTGSGTGTAVSFVDIFTGNGITATFNLSFSPQTLANISVSVGGVDQAPGEVYSLVGENTLSFTSPIPDGIKVIVRYIQAVELTDIEAANVLTDPFGGNTIPDGSSVQSALQALESAIESGTGGTGGYAGPATILTDIFESDGATLTYALTGNPEFINNIFVDVGGISNIPGEDYTWDIDTNTLTFSAAPPIGEPIVIRYIQALILDPNRVGVARLDTFEGDGSTLSFELTNEPTAFETIFVSIGGILQTPSESYTLVEPRTLVFSEAVPAGLKIVVQYNSSFTGYNTPTTSLYRNRFTGNGVQTEFGLSFNPGSIDNLDVVLGGVVQDPGEDYIYVAPRTVRFSEAPDSDVALLIKGSRVNNALNELQPSVPRVEVFSGDGTQTEFELSFNPGSQNNITATAGGVSLTPILDYRWTGGTNFTLVDPLGVDETLVVRYYSAVTLGEITASDISTESFSGTIIPDGATTQVALQSLETELSKTTLLVNNTPIFDWKTGETAATRTARLQETLAQGLIYGGCNIKSGSFDLDPFRISGNMTIEMSPNTLLDFSASTAASGACLVLGTDSTVVPGTSTLDSTNLLPAPTGDIKQDSRTLVFSAPHGLVKGDRGYVHRNVDNSWINTFISGTSRTYYKAGEYFRVLSVVSATEIEIDRAWLHNYAADGLTIIIKLVMTTMNVYGGNIRGRYEDILDGDDTVNNSAVIAYNLVNSNISDLHIQDAEQAGLSMRRCINTSVENFAFEDYNPVSLGLNYGLALMSCSDITIKNPQIRSKRHGLTLTSGIAYGVPNRHIYIIGGTINGDAMALDSHGHSEHYSAVGTTLMGGAVLGGDYSDLINCEIYTGRTGDYTGVGIMYRERKGCNARIVGCKVYTTANPGGRYPVQLNIANVDDSAFAAADQGGLTELDVVVYNDFDNATQIRLGGGVVAGQTMIWKIKAQALDIASELSEIERPRPNKSLVCYLDPSANLGDHQLVLLDQLDNVRIATSSAYAPRSTIILNNRSKGPYVDLDGTANGISINLADASYKREVEVRGSVIRGMQGAGVYIAASSNTQDVEVRLFGVDSRDNSQETATTSTQRASIVLSNIKSGVLKDCIVGDEQSVPTQTKRISLQNCGVVELDSVIRVGSNVSDDYTGTTMVYGRNFKQDRLTRTDTASISSSVTTVAGGAAIEELSGNITANRAYNLSVTGAPNGYRRYIYRTTGGGAFTWGIGSLFNLALGQWCIIEFDYTAQAWKLVASGDLVSRRQWTEYYASDANPASAITSLNNGTTYIFTGTLTAARAITLSTTSSLQYDRKRFINNGTNYWWDIGGLIYLLPGEECTVEYNGSAWVMLKAPRGQTVVKQSGVKVATVTGNGSVQNLVTIPLPPLGPNDQISVYSVYSMTGSTNSKTLSWSLGGTDMFSVTVNTSEGRYTDERVVANRNSTSSQICSANTGGSNWGTSSTTSFTSAVNTGVSQNVVISGQMTTTTEEIAIELYRVVLHRA